MTVPPGDMAHASARQHTWEQVRCRLDSSPNTASCCCADRATQLVHSSTSTLAIHSAALCCTQPLALYSAKLLAYYVLPRVSRSASLPLNNSSLCCSLLKARQSSPSAATHPQQTKVSRQPKHIVAAKPAVSIPNLRVPKNYNSHKCTCGRQLLPRCF